MKRRAEGSISSSMASVATASCCWHRVRSASSVWPSFGRSSADALYAGYVPRQEAEIAAFRRDQALTIPADFDYMAVKGLSVEARQKLDRLRPATLAHSGLLVCVTPAALGLILGLVRKAAIERHRDAAPAD